MRLPWRDPILGLPTAFLGRPATLQRLVYNGEESGDIGRKLSSISSPVAVSNQMGVRFSCHGCAKPLNIKLELAGRRGVCPECGLRFRIPKTDAEFSIPLEDVRNTSGGQQSTRRQNAVASASANGNAGGMSESSVAVVEQQAATAGSLETTLGAQSSGEVAHVVPSSQGDDPISKAIELIASDASATWYVRPPSGGQYGPANGEALKNWITEGRVAKTALLWRDGWPQWREACEALPEIADLLPGAFDEEAESVFGQPVQAGVASSTNGSSASHSHSGTAASGTAASGTAASGTAASGIEVIKTQESVSLRGTHDLGATRRERSSRRKLMVALLAMLVIGLVVTLILVANGSLSGGG